VQCVWHRTQTFKQLHRRSLLLSLRMPRSAVALAVAIVMVSVGAGQAQVGPGALASFAAESAQLSTSGTPATVDVGVGGRTVCVGRRSASHVHSSLQARAVRAAADHEIRLVRADSACDRSEEM
jgi:hypothetical protein